MTDKRTLEEAYESATQSSDLSLSPEKRGDVDILIAAGWTDSRLGGALLRLHTKATMNQILEVLDQIERVTRNRGFSMETSEKVLAWWLDQTCKHCDGHGRTKIPGAPTLSAHQCPVCRGSGKKRIPHGEDGKWVANLLDDCVNKWRQSLKGRFRHQNN